MSIIKRRVNRKHSHWMQLSDALDALYKEAKGIKADAIKERAPIRPDAIIKEVFSSRDFYQAAEAKRKVFIDAGKYNTDKNYASMISPEGVRAKVDNRGDNAQVLCRL